MTFYTVLKEFLAKYEGFSPTPYWDVRQWSWGYGTRAAPLGTKKTEKPNKTISKTAAWAESINHINEDYDYLKKLVKVQLNSNQWAALLSFSYNLGRGNADNLLNNINSNNLDALRAQWLSYNKKRNSTRNLVVDAGLTNRRIAEFNLFTKSSL